MEDAADSDRSVDRGERSDLVADLGVETGPFVKWGHLLRFDPAEIDAWLDQARFPVGRG